MKYSPMPISETSPSETMQHEIARTSIFCEQIRFLTMKYIEIRQMYKSIFFMLELLSTEFTPPRKKKTASITTGISASASFTTRLPRISFTKNDIAMSITVAARDIVFMKGSRRKTRSTPASG